MISDSKFLAIVWSVGGSAMIVLVMAFLFQSDGPDPLVGISRPATVVNRPPRLYGTGGPESPSLVAPGDVDAPAPERPKMAIDARDLSEVLRGLPSLLSRPLEGWRMAQSTHQLTRDRLYSCCAKAS